MTAREELAHLALMFPRAVEWAIGPAFWARLKAEGVFTGLAEDRRDEQSEVYGSFTAVRTPLSYQGRRLTKMLPEPAEDAGALYQLLHRTGGWVTDLRIKGKRPYRLFYQDRAYECVDASDGLYVYRDL